MDRKTSESDPEPPASPRDWSPQFFGDWVARPKRSRETPGITSVPALVPLAPVMGVWDSSPRVFALARWVDNPPRIGHHPRKVTDAAAAAPPMPIPSLTWTRCHLGRRWYRPSLVSDLFAFCATSKTHPGINANHLVPVVCNPTPTDGARFLIIARPNPPTPDQVAEWNDNRLSMPTVANPVRWAAPTDDAT